MSSSSGRMNASTLTRLVQRFLKCQDHAELNRLQAQDHLFKQLLLLRSEEEQASKNAAEIMDYLASLGPRKVCQYQFKSNDIVWICKECQKDETCVICNECYQASNHEGHDVYFYHSVVGGCCDCGDADAWCSKGFCTNHGQSTSDPVTFIPKDICHVSTVIFDEIAEALLKYGRYMVSLYDLEAPRRNRPDDPSTVVMMYDEYHTVEEFTVLLNIATGGPIPGAVFQATGSALLHSGDFEDCRSMAEEMQMKGFNVYLGYESDKALENRMVAAVTFLHELAVRSDGMCRLICNTLDEDILTSILTYHLQLSKELGRILYDLLMILMSDQAFKVVIAVAYTQAYAKIARLYGRGLGLSAQSVYSLSVQFLNRELFVNEICYGGHDFLKISVAAVTSLLEHAQQMSRSELPFATGNQLSLSMTKALKHNIIIKRRYNPIIGDLKVIFTNRRVARYFLSTSLPEILNVLESFQYVQPQERALFMHVEYEDRDWMAAFNLTLGITSLFDFLFPWFADPDSSCAMEVSYNGYSSYPDSFTTLRCVEDGWLSPEAQDATSPGKEGPSTSNIAGTGGKGIGVRSLMRSLSGRVTQYFNPSTVPSTAAALPYSSGAPAAAAEPSSSRPANAHKLSSAWSVLHTIAERCFAWERRFRDTSGIAVTLPPRERSSSSTYAQYGAGFGEDVQLIDLIQDYALKGVGKLPRLMSFHIPLHRMLSHAIFEACKHQHLTACLRSLQGFLAEKATSNEVPLSSTIDIPLFCIILSTQINLHMWQRNGQCMADQALNYCDYPFCRIYKEMDTLLIQFLLTVHPTDQFVGQLFYRFGVAEYLAHRKITAAHVDASYLPNLVDESLKYIVNLVTELPTPSVIHASTPTPSAAAKDDTGGADATADEAPEAARSAKHAWSQNLLNESAGRLLPLVRRELLHKLIGGPVTYSQLQECFGIYPEASKLDSDLIDAIITELTVKHDNILHGAPTYTLKKELWAEYDPCFPRVPGSVHQKAFEDRPKITATAPIVSKPFAPHECFATVRNHMLLAPVLLRVQRDLLYVAAAERCAKKEVYKAVREKWTLKCNDSIYGKVLQLLTLAIYVTKDMKAATTADGADAVSSLESTLSDQVSAGASTALEKFMLEEIFLPDSESAFNAVLTTVDGTRLPSLLHVLLDIFHANDPLDANSKHWVLWLIEQTSQLSAECARSAEKYRMDNGIVTATAGTKAAGGVGGAAAENINNNKALSAKEKAMQAMQAKAAQFMMMMEGMSDDSDEEDEDNGTVAKPAAPAKTSTPEHEGSSADGSSTVTPQKDGKAGGAETVLSDHNASPMPVETPQGGATAEDGDAVPVCIICQADANAEDSAGNMRLLGYLALVQASTLLTHPEGCLDCSTHMCLAETIPSISSKVAPKKLSSECNAQISFCGHGMHYDCFETYLKSQLRKSAEQGDMVLDQTKLQFCCPLCKKLGNLFMPYVETDPVKIEVREAAKAKLAAAALKKKQAAVAVADSQDDSRSGASDPSSGIAFGIDRTGDVPNTLTHPGIATAAADSATAAAVSGASAGTTASLDAVWPDITVMPKVTIPLFPASSSAMDCDGAPAVTENAPLQKLLCWTRWIDHPSLLNSDLSAFARTRSASVSAVTFAHPDATSQEKSSKAQKRARSQTNDSAEFGRFSSKANTGEAPGIAPEASADCSPLPGGDMEQVEGGGDDDGSGDNNDGEREGEQTSQQWQADYMSYTLNDIDLNSTSTERNATAAAALEAELRGISIDTLGSFEQEERESEQYEFLMDFAFNALDQQVALSEQEKVRRMNNKVLETLRSHSTESMLQNYLKRKAWSIFLEDYVGAVYSDITTMRSSTLLESRINQPSVFSYAVVAPFLEAILRSVAYSASCDLAEHNIPGYHLLSEPDLTAALVGGAAATADVSGEKAGASTAPVDPPFTQAAAVDLSAAPWMYIKKYSLGMDEYRHLEKTVDAVACVLHSFDCLDFVNHSVKVMFGGVSSQVTADSPGKAAAAASTTTATGRAQGWMPVPSELSFSARRVPAIRTAPMLASPLLDMLVLCISLAKAAPAGSPPTSSTVMSPKSSRQTQRGPLYHPLWNIEHCCRWICIAKLAQLLVLEAEATTVEAERAESDPFSAWPSVAPFVNALFGQVCAGVAKDGKGEAGAESTASITQERAAQVMFQWVTFMRTAMHLVYRTNKALFSQNASYAARPSDWLQCCDVSTSVLVQSAADATDQQVCRHLTLLGLSELICADTTCTALNDTQSNVLTAAGRWVSDLLHSTQCAAVNANVDVGVSSAAELFGFLKGDPDVVGSISASDVVTKPPANVESPVTASTLKSQWDTLRCYPRCSRPSLITLPREYTKLHAMVQSKVSAYRTAQPASTAADGKTAFETPALCLVCAAVLDAAGKGQCAAHTMKCGGEAGVFFLLQECQVLLTHGPRSIYFSSPYVDVYGESQHLFRGKPLLLDARRYEALRHLWSSHQIPREVASKRSTATRIVINNYY